MLTRFVGSLILTLIVGSCTYTGTLDTPLLSANDETSRFHIIQNSVAIVADTRLRNLEFSAEGGGHGVDIKIGDAIIQGFKNELSRTFANVSVVHTFPNPGEADFAANIVFRWKETYRNSLTGDLRYEVLSRLELKPVSLRFPPHVFDDIQEVNYSPGAAATAASVATGASLFLLAPLTIPLTTSAIGSQAEDMLANTISTATQEIGEKIRSDTSLRDELLTRNATQDELGRRDSETLHEGAQSNSPYEHFLDAVVVVMSTEGLGTGFFVSETGLAVTNAHVIGNDVAVTIKERNGRVSRAQVVACLREDDLALIKIADDNRSWLSLASPKDIAVGRDVLAIGAPQGLTWSVSKGIISAIRQTKSNIFIQTDAAINKGNSGGPLIDLITGRVVGVNSFILRGDQAEGLGFAVSAEKIRGVMQKYSVTN